MMESAAGNAAERSGRKSSCGARLRLRFVRAVVLWPRIEVSGTSDWRPAPSSCAAGRDRQRNSIVGFGCAVEGRRRFCFLVVVLTRQLLAVLARRRQNTGQWCVAGASLAAAGS